LKTPNELLPGICITALCAGLDEFLEGHVECLEPRDFGTFYAMRTITEARLPPRLPYEYSSMLLYRALAVKKGN
jgi:hypothetical protein